MICTAQPAYRAIRNKLLISCATAAIATGAVTPQRAHAQVAGAFRGSITATTGTVSRNQTSGTTETISVGSPTATIDWNPLGEINQDGNMVFLPAGNVATFQGDANAGDYTVLNRILPDGAVAIQFDGTVNSLVDGGATGGKIWFYSPNGLVIGSTAVFDVGGLLLTTLEPTTFDPGSTSFFESFGQGQMATDPTAKIQIASGAQIKALAANSYVALIAPRIEQGGTVQVNGSAAYAAGEGVTMTMNQGLFDIAIDVGTDDGAGVVHTGSTTGPANQAATDNHGIYMVAVPKHTALTMLLGGTVGFDDAVSADVENGAIYISSGAHVSQGDNGPVFIAANAPDSMMEIGSGTYTSSLTGYATGDASVLATGGSITFTQDLTLQSVNGIAELLASGTGNVLEVDGDARVWANAIGTGGHAEVDANSGGTVHVLGDLNLQASGSASDGGGATGGTIDVTANGGFVTVDGQLEADAVAFLSGPNSDGFSFDGQGGTINFHSLGTGEIKAGSLLANASAWGGTTNGGGTGAAGNATGGTIVVNAELGGKFTVIGSAQANADAYGGDVFGTGTQAGSGSGGSVTLLAHGGTIKLGSASLSADGNGGGSSITSSGAGGNGQGGGVRLEAEDANSSIQVTGDFFANANGHGGSGISGGSGFGGNAGLESYGGSMQLGTINLNAVGTGGDADLGFGGAGGYAEGGVAYVQAEAVNAPTSLISAGDVDLDVEAWGGAGGAGDGGNIAAGVGGDAQGGLYVPPPPNTPATGGAFVLADSAGGQFQLGNVSRHAG
jgi:filamentous hemagglutinin family protein